MSQTSRPIHFGFALCFLFLWLTAAAGQGHNAQSSSRKQVSAYQFCWAGEAVGMHRMFYSGIFVLTTDDARHQAPGAFLKFLEEKYSFKPDPSTELNVSCNDQLTEAGAIKNKQTYLGRGQKGKVVETGWRYGSPTTAPAASVTPEDATTVVRKPKSPLNPGTYYWVCNGQDNEALYLSAVFTTPVPVAADAHDPSRPSGHTATTNSPTGLAHGGGRAANPLPWVERFLQLLVQSYSYNGRLGVSCDNWTTLPEAQQRLQADMEYGRHNKIRVVETGWTWKNE